MYCLSTALKSILQNGYKLSDENIRRAEWLSYSAQKTHTNWQHSTILGLYIFILAIFCKTLYRYSHHHMKFREDAKLLLVARS